MYYIVSDRNFSNILKAVLATFSLSLFNIIFIIGSFFGLLGGIIGLWAGAVSLSRYGYGGVFPMGESVGTGSERIRKYGKYQRTTIL